MQSTELRALIASFNFFKNLCYVAGKEQQSVTCTAQATWSDTFPVCDIVTCGPVTSPEHGSVGVTSETYLSQAHFACDPGMLQFALYVLCYFMSNVGTLNLRLLSPCIFSVNTEIAQANA